jgi:hypothetical protein
LHSALETGMTLHPSLACCQSFNPRPTEQQGGHDPKD